MQELIDLGHRFLTGFFNPHRLMVKSGVVLVALDVGGVGTRRFISAVGAENRRACSPLH